MGKRAGDGVLVRMAGEMREMLDTHPRGWVHRRLGRGLEIVLQRNEHQWRLAIARRHFVGPRSVQVIYPSDTEANICAQAFQVPAGSEPQRSTRAGRTAKGDRKSLYGLIEWNWLECEPIERCMTETD